MIEPTITEEQRVWEQNRLEQELKRVPTLGSPPPTLFAPKSLSASSLTQPRPWNYNFADVFTNPHEKKMDIEEKLCIKYRELAELKEDREQAERGILRCRAEIDDLIKTMTSLKESSK